MVGPVWCKGFSHTIGNSSRHLTMVHNTNVLLHFWWDDDARWRQPKYLGKSLMVIKQEEKVVQLSLCFTIEWENSQLSQKQYLQPSGDRKIARNANRGNLLLLQSSIPHFSPQTWIFVQLELITAWKLKAHGRPASFHPVWIKLEARKDISEKVKKGLVWNQTLHPKRELQSNSTSKHWSLSISCYIKISIRFCSMTMLGRKAAVWFGWGFLWSAGPCHGRTGCFSPGAKHIWELLIWQTGEGKAAELSLCFSGSRSVFGTRSRPCRSPAQLHCSVLFFPITSIYFWKSYKKACTNTVFQSLWTSGCFMLWRMRILSHLLLQSVTTCVTDPVVSISEPAH